jgi:hypothetical protein
MTKVTEVTKVTKVTEFSRITSESSESLESLESAVIGLLHFSKREATSIHVPVVSPELRYLLVNVLSQEMLRNKF